MNFENIVLPGNPEQFKGIPQDVPKAESKSFSIDDVFSSIDKDNHSAASAVVSKDPELANRERVAARNADAPRPLVEANLDQYEKQDSQNKISEILDGAPSLARFLANNQSNAPIFKDDLAIYRDVESSLSRFGVVLNEENNDLELADYSETGWQAARKDVVQNATVGFASGRSIGEQGTMWAKARDSMIEIDEAFKKRSSELDKDMEAMRGNDSWIASAAEIVGTMYSAISNSANETAIGSGALVGAGMAVGLGAPALAPIAGAMLMGGSMRAMYDIEGGLAYKDMLEKGASEEEARAISRGVGLLNSLIEVGGVTLLGKAAAPLVRQLTTKHAAKTAAALATPEMGAMMIEASKTMVKGVGAEVTTEVMQELVNVAGEGLANEFAGATFDEVTGEALFDRLSDVAVKTAKGMMVLGALGLGPTVVASARKVYKAREAEDFFSALNEGMSKSVAVEMAPEVVAEAVQQMAEESSASNVYVDAAEFSQLLLEHGITTEQLEDVLPGVGETLAQKALNKEDLVIPTGQYAAKIAGTDLGKSLTQHVRLSSDALSAADAVKLKNETDRLVKAATEGKLKDEELDKSVAKISSDEYKAEYDKLKTQMFEQIKAAGVYNETEAKTNAKYGAWLVTNLARRAGLDPSRVAELAPAVSYVTDSSDYNSMDILALKKQSETFDKQLKDWEKGKGAFRARLGKPSWVLQIFGAHGNKQLNTTRADFIHVLFPEKVKVDGIEGKHNISADNLRGLLVGIQQPLAVFKSATVEDSIVLLTELKFGGKNIVVPVHLTTEKDGALKVDNFIPTAYSRKSVKSWIEKGLLLGYEKDKGPEVLPSDIGYNSQQSDQLDSGSKSDNSSKPVSVIVYQNETSLGDVYQESGDEVKRGSYSPSLNRVSLTPSADLSTFAHEMGHWYLETLFAIYGETTSASVRSDVEVMLKDFGLKSVEEWKALSFDQREVLHERFAFYVEQYLAEGKAPTKETQGFFKRFGAWIRDVYSRFGTGAKEELNKVYRNRFDIELPEMSAEVRRVLDRMIAAESAIKTAEAAEGIVPLFKQKPADMSDALWEQLMQESDDSNAEAANKVFERMARDEKWYSNARSKKLKEIQAKAEEVRSIVRDKVEKDLDETAQAKAFNMVKVGGLKMDPKLLAKEGFDSVTINALKKAGLCKVGGMSAMSVRELIRSAKNYQTPKKMIAEFLQLADREKLVDELTTKRCLKEYSELFDAKKRDSVVSEAIHNEARGRFVATELSYLANDKEGRSRIYREAARRAAEQIVNGMPIGSVNVRKFIGAEARASRKAHEALQAGNRYAAVLAKRAQLVQHEAALMAIEIEAEMRRVKSLKERIFKADKKLSKTHDIDIINVARYVLTNEGLGKSMASEFAPSSAIKYIEKLEKYDNEKYEMFGAMIDKHGYKGNIDFSNYTVKYAMEVLEDVQMLYRMAREAKTLMLDGKRLDREEVVNELVERFEMVGRAEWDGGKDRILSASGRLAYTWMSLKAKMIRVEQWCHAMDGGQNGPFFKYIYLPVANAAAKYRNLNNKTQEALVNVLKPMIDKWSNVREIDASEIGYTFATKAELIGALLHTGNESNKNKMLLGGRGEGKPWARLVELQDGSNFVDTTQWDSFVARAMQDGTITKEDMDVVQQIWDLTESTKPVAQAAFKAMYGTYFEEVEETEVVTPWGNYRGGYVPAITDRYLVPEKQTQEEAKRITQQDFVSQMPVHQPGFSKSRVPNYTKPLALDVGLLCGHIQEVLKFAVMAPVAQEVAKVISDKRFADPIEKNDPTIISQVLVPWLKRSYEQTVSDGKTDDFSSKLNQLRGIAGMNIMAGHVVNALQQWTGLSIAATKVKPTYMAKALADLFKQKAKISDVMELSPFMKARLNDRAFEFQSQIERIVKTSENVKQAKGVLNKAVALDEKLDAARDWASRHGYFLQTAMQAPIDSIVWLGAYNQSIDDGMSAEDAIASADSIVRTTQSAFDPESVAGIETGGALYRCFLVFYNYFNMQLNLLGESWEGTKHTKKYGKFALDAMFIVAIPSILSAILTQMLAGFDTGDDDKWDAYDTMRLFIAEPIKNVLAMAPFLGGAVTAGGTVLANADLESTKWAKFIWGEDPYQGRMMNAPAFDILATGGTSVLQWMKAAEDEDFNARGAVRGTLDLLSVATRLPLGALKKPGGWIAGYLAGDIEPESASEVVRGLLTGKDVSE